MHHPRPTNVCMYMYVQMYPRTCVCISHDTLNNAFFLPHNIVLFLVCIQLGMGVAAVIGPHNRDLSTHVHSVCSRLEVPYIRTGIIEPRPSGQTQPDANLYTINVHPGASQLNRAYLSVIRFHRWTMFCIVFGSNQGRFSVSTCIPFKIHTN